MHIKSQIAFKNFKPRRLPKKFKQVLKCSDIRSSPNNTLFNSRLDGDIILKTDDLTVYTEASKQHFTPNNASLTAPFAIIYPKSISDIIKIVRYAKKCKFKIVVRSGGHQYNGFSSCVDCIQIDMKHFNKTKILGNRNFFLPNKYSEFTSINIGSGNNLESLYNFLNTNGLFIPVGACSTVGVGGHTQTGGFGELNRFGIFADYVIGFDIVLSDGKLYKIIKPSLLYLYRKKYPWFKRHRFNNDIYYSVLGGGSGSWGVIVNVQYIALKDSNYINNYIINIIWPYNKELFTKLLSIWSDYMNTMDVDYDPNLSFRLLFGVPPGFSSYFVSINGFWANIDSNYAFNSTYFDMFWELLNEYSPIPPAIVLTNISSISSYFKNAIFDTTDTPYKKYIVSSRNIPCNYNLDNTFVDGMVNNIDNLVNGSVNGVGVRSMFFVPKYYDKTKILQQINSNFDYTATQFRDTKSNILFSEISIDEDIDNNAYDNGVNWINTVWNETFNNNFPKSLTLAYSETIESRNINDVYQYYYENKYVYNKLRRTKTKIDKIDLFHTSFTIPTY